MKTMLKTAAMSTVIIGLAAGSAIAGSDDPAPQLLKGSQIHGADVSNEFDKNLADIQHLVIDSNTGRVAYAVIDTNNAMNLGDKLIAVPYGALNWDSATRRFRINATEEQLRSLPSYDPRDIRNLNDESWMSSLRAIFGDRDDLTATTDDVRCDEYTSFFDNASEESLEGEVDLVKRESLTVRGNKHLAIVVNRPDMDQPVTVYLGPESYLKQQMIVPQVGQPIAVTTVRAYDSEGQIVHVARRIKLGEKSLELRDKDGMPRWDGAASGMTEAPAYVLSTELDDGDVMALGEKFGDVKEIVYEVHSGTAAFVIVSVGGVLGIDDTLYPVPWEALKFGKNSNLFSHMSVSELKLAPKLSESGVADLSNEEFVQRTCEFFDVEDVKFDTDRSSQWSAQHVAGRTPTVR